MLPSTLHAQNLPQELQVHHICINVENVGEGRWVQSKDTELEEEHLECPGYAACNKRMLVRSQDNYPILMRPEVDTEKLRSKSKQIDIFRIQSLNRHITNTVRMSPISLTSPCFL